MTTSTQVRLFTKKYKEHKKPKLAVGYLVETIDGEKMALYWGAWNKDVFKWKEFSKEFRIFKTYFKILNNMNRINSSFKFITKEEV